ncbi:hypothetical protein [Arthrobacter sp. TMN-50]
MTGNTADPYAHQSITARAGTPIHFQPGQGWPVGGHTWTSLAVVDPENSAFYPAWRLEPSFEPCVIDHMIWRG